MGWHSPLTGEIFDNVVQIDAQVHLPPAFRAKKFLQVELIAYLRRWAWSQESFVMGSAPGFVAEPWAPGSDGVIQAGFAPGGGEAGSARGFFNIDRTFGMAILSFNNKAPRRVDRTPPRNYSFSWSQGDPRGAWRSTKVCPQTSLFT